jgi:hypothetical protein
LVNKEINNEEKDRRKVKKELKEPRKYRKSSFCTEHQKEVLHRAKGERRRGGEEERTILRTGLVTSCVGTAFSNTLLKER